MRRDRRIINLYDKPLYPRTQLRPPPSPSSDVVTALLLSSTIVLGTAGFFLAYDAIAKRGTAFVPAITEGAKPVPRWNVSEAPKPDMYSSAVTVAQADVPAVERTARVAAPEQSAAIPEKRVDDAPKKKKVRAIQHLPTGRALGYAAAPSFYRPPAPFGSW